MVITSKAQVTSFFRAALFFAAAFLVAFFSIRYNYNIFHVLFDGVSIVVATSIFTIIWNSRRLIDNEYFLFIAIAFLFFALLDLMHVMGNKGMGIFPPHYGNLGPVFYIASRYLLSVSFLVAPAFIRRKVNTGLTITAYSAATILFLLSLLYWENFPACIVEGVGLTPFKIVSDYVICLILLAAAVLLYINRRSFDSRVMRLMLYSIALSIATGLTFALYTDPFGLTNMLGHFFQIGSFYLAYLAFVETSVTNPQKIIYRKLKQNEEALAEKVDELDNANLRLQREIAERRLVEQSLNESDARYRLLSATAGRLLQSDNPQAIVEDLCRDVMAHLDCQAFFNFLADEKSGRLRLNACAGIPEKEVRNLEWLDYGVAVCGCVAQAKARMIAEDIFNVPDVRTDLVKSFGIQAYCCHPLMAQDRLIGTLSFGTTTRAHFKPKEVELMRIVADQVAVAMERKLAQETVSHAKLVWERTFDSVPDLIAILDENHRILRTNKAMADRLKVEPGTCLGHACYEVVHGLNRPPAFCPHTLALADGQEHVAEVHEPCLGGDFLVSSTPLTDDAGRPIGSVHVARDITSRKKYEEALRERSAQLERANKELESFSYSVSHDLRAPLRTIDGFSKMVLRDAGEKLDEESRRKLNIVREGTEKMNRLIDDLLRLSRLGRQALSPFPLDMTKLCREAWDELRQSAPDRDVRISLGKLDEAVGDRGLIRQVVLNILSNALKYSSNRNPAIIEVESARSNGFIVFSVKDNGVGFDMKFYDKLFGVFQRLHAKSEFEGTGVGLAIVQRIVQRHGGRVWAEGEPGKGAAFHFTLPAAESPKGSPNP